MKSSSVPNGRSNRGLRHLSHVLLFGLGMAVASGVGGSTGCAATNDLPAGSEHYAGKMVFGVLVTPDLLTAERFYTNLFRWSFQNSYVGTTLIGQASFDGRIIAAIVQKPLPQGRNAAWRSFLSADDIDKTADLAVQNGATMLVAPHDIPDLGRDALLTDPQGAVFGMLALNSGDPADILAQPGEWIWSSLITPDPDSDAAFYKTVFGYAVFHLPDPQDAKHMILASDDYARASINPMPVDRPASHARWISYVRVADVNAAAQSATALGGHVVLAPHADREGSMVALIADPTGALFGLLQWSDDAAVGDAK